ncbi:MAG TPA: penicillin-binding transpeptidase domain-containing protein, partial [Pirellulales bacterium]|nr:penicillin-binding transpeptidase domain-containing protein [Pirellulales bacterium]
MTTAFAIACAGIFARLVSLELTHGDEYRAEAGRPTVKNRVIPAPRGRILAHDGAVLATDRPLVSLALAYRWLQEPADPHWLRAMARSRLAPHDRRKAVRVAEEEARINEERADLHQRLAELCGLTAAEWGARRRKVQLSVEEIAARVNERHNAREADGATVYSSAEADDSSDDSWLGSAVRKIAKALFQANVDPPTEIVVAEEQQDHVLFEGLSLEAVAEIEGHPESYPGTSIVRGASRTYPAGTLAAHIVGYARPPRAGESPNGQAGVERQYDALIRGKNGAAIDRFDRRGRMLASSIEREPAAGRDLVLTVDSRLQSSVEPLLDAALARRITTDAAASSSSSGGAIIVMDVRNGAILAAASAPRFEPAAFADRDAAAIDRTLSDPAHPLFDRTIQMAIPPGSVFKLVTALALLDSPAFDPVKPFDCQGYLDSPEGRRCMIYRRYGVGHGPVTLRDAIAESCNVYFFHHADSLGAAPIADWARRTGFGERSGVDLAGEAAGRLPELSADQPSTGGRHPRHTELAESLAIGQGTLTVTPVQIVRLTAAIANGGRLVTPHVADSLGLPSDPGDLPSSIDAAALDIPPPKPIPGLDARKLELLREALRRVVTDPKGTAHSAAGDGLSFAGKTGTAETNRGSADHAWFAGYAPA